MFRSRWDVIAHQILSEVKNRGDRFCNWTSVIGSGDSFWTGNSIAGIKQFVIFGTERVVHAWIEMVRSALPMYIISVNVVGVVQSRIKLSQLLSVPSNSF